MPVALRECGDEELRRRLEDALAEVAEGTPRVVELERGPFAYETSFAIDELRVRLDDGEELDLLVKDVGAGLSATAATTKPARALDPRREIAVYRHLLRPSGALAPRFFGAAEDEGAGCAWLFLERVRGEVLADEGDLAAWRAAAAWAAKLDAAVEEHRDPAVERHLLDRDRAWYQHWLAAAIAACEAGEQTELAARLRDGGGALLDRLDGLPRAFVHGELYASNVIVARQEPADAARVKPVDWEMTGTGPFALDLAALVTGWSGADREAMYEAFGAALAGETTAISSTDLGEAVSLCELALALQWLGWAEDWQPPAEHRRDWAADAARLLEETGL
jgi:aminoglycoside phosphotransferase (APT) family kinase protein